jgi:phosphoglycolate phosphatase
MVNFHASKVLPFPLRRGIGPGMTDGPFPIVGFDLDGTLLDTHEDLGAALNHALRLGGRDEVAMDTVRTLVGGGSKRLLVRALDLTGGRADDAAFERMHSALLDFYEANLAVHSRLFPGGEQALDALTAKGVRLAVVTNKLERFAIGLLDQLGLSRRFYTILGGDSLGPGKGKPAPDLLLEMVARGAGSRAAYVGDTTYDTHAAKAAGLPCVALDFGYNDLPAQDLGANAVISHYDDLVCALERIG